MVRKYLLSNKKLSSMVILFTILQSIFTAGLAIVFGSFIDAATKITNDAIEFKTLLLYSVLLFVYISLLVAFDYLRRYYRSGFFAYTDQTIKMEYYNRLVTLHVKDYAKREKGYYLSRFLNDLPIVIKDYVMEFYNLVLYLFQAIFAIAAAC